MKGYSGKACLINKDKSPLAEYQACSIRQRFGRERRTITAPCITFPCQAVLARRRANRTLGRSKVRSVACMTALPHDRQVEHGDAMSRDRPLQPGRVSTS